jgi:hypothetical protein
MACDSAYLPYALTLAASIRRWHPKGGFDIVLASQEQVAIPAALEALEVGLLPLGENPFEGGPHEGRHGGAAYLRLLLPDLLDGRYDRLLYLDSDILCTGPGLDRLLRAEMGGAWLAAVRDNTQWRTPGRRLPEFRALGRHARAYFNSGVLLIDVQAWREAQVLDRALALFRGSPGAILRHDQSLLNLIADGAWAEMSPVWNWQYTWSSRFFADLAEPRIVHFIGPRKPWSPAGADLPLRFRQPFAEMLESYFPARTVPDRHALAWPGSLRRSLLKHWTAVPAMERYLRRFPDPFQLVPAG